MTITLITAGFMLLINFILAFNVIRQRFKTQTMLGEGEAPDGIEIGPGADLGFGVILFDG